MYPYFPIWLIVAFVVLIIWTAVVKGIALWFAGKNKQKAWFIFLFIFNTAGILPLVYIIGFRKKTKKKS